MLGIGCIRVDVKLQKIRFFEKISSNTFGGCLDRNNCANRQPVTEIELNWSKKMRSNQCLQVTSVFTQQCFWPSDLPPVSLVTRGFYGPLLFPSCKARSNKSTNGDREGMESVCKKPVCRI